MKTTGFVRRIDDLGRVVIPKEVRRILRLQDGEGMEIFISDGGVLFKKYDETKITEEIVDSLIENVSGGCFKNTSDIMQKISEIKELLKESGSE